MNFRSFDYPVDKKFAKLNSVKLAKFANQKLLI